jgi:hypothetical protein
LANQVREQAIKYFNIVLDQKTARGRAEAAKNGLVETLDIYKSFHSIQRQTTWWYGRVVLLFRVLVKLDKKDSDRRSVRMDCHCRTMI